MKVHGKDAVWCGGTATGRGEYSTVQYSTATGRGEEPGVTDTRVPQLGQRYFRNDLTTMTSLLTRAVNV